MLIKDIYQKKRFSECNWYLYVTDLDVSVADHETRLTVAEENIQGSRLTLVYIVVLPCIDHGEQLHNYKPSF